MDLLVVVKSRRYGEHCRQKRTGQAVGGGTF